MVPKNNNVNNDYNVVNNDLESKEEENRFYQQFNKEPEVNHLESTLNSYEKVSSFL